MSEPTPNAKSAPQPTAPSAPKAPPPPWVFALGLAGAAFASSFPLIALNAGIVGLFRGDKWLVKHGFGSVGLAIAGLAASVFVIVAGHLLAIPVVLAFHVDPDAIPADLSARFQKAAMALFLGVLPPLAATVWAYRDRHAVLGGPSPRQGRKDGAREDTEGGSCESDSSRTSTRRASGAGR